MCSQMLRSRKRNAQRLCAEGKPLFYRRVHRRHTRTRIETKASLDTLGGKLSWFLHPDRNVTESRLGMRCFSLSLWLFLHVLLTQLGGLGEEAAPLSAGRDVCGRKCPGRRGRERSAFVLFMFICLFETQCLMAAYSGNVNRTFTRSPSQTRRKYLKVRECEAQYLWSPKTFRAKLNSHQPHNKNSWVGCFSLRGLWVLSAPRRWWGEEEGGSLREISKSLSCTLLNLLWHYRNMSKPLSAPKSSGLSNALMFPSTSTHPNWSSYLWSSSTLRRSFQAHVCPVLNVSQEDI